MGMNYFLVAATGWAQDDDRTRIKDAGFEYHLTKPIRSVAHRRSGQQLKLYQSADGSYSGTTFKPWEPMMKKTATHGIVEAQEARPTSVDATASRSPESRNAPATRLEDPSSSRKPRKAETTPPAAVTNVPPAEEPL